MKRLALGLGGAVQIRALVAEDQMADVRCQMSDVRYQMSDVRCQILDVRYQILLSGCGGGCSRLANQAGQHALYLRHVR